MNHTEETMLHTEQLFDMSYVNKICRNNADTVKKMVTVFINTIPAAVIEIEQQYQTQDYDAVKKTAHRIKPVIMYYAIVKAERIILDIEMMAKNRTGLEQLGNKIEILKNTLGDVVVQMKTEFNIL